MINLAVGFTAFSGFARTDMAGICYFNDNLLIINTFCRCQLDGIHSY
jgi:hypothetical protein